MTRLDRRRLFAYQLASLIILADAHGIQVAPFSFFRTA